jgi:hypothetical protein
VLYDQPQGLENVLRLGEVHLVNGAYLDCQRTMLREELRFNPLNNSDKNSIATHFMNEEFSLKNIRKDSILNVMEDTE